MPKRPRTTESVDSASSGGSRWSLGRLTKLPSFPTHTLASTHAPPSAPPMQAPARKSRYHQHQHINTAVLASPSAHSAPASAVSFATDGCAHSPVHSRIYTSDSTSASPTSPSLRAKQLVSGFQSFVTSRLHRTRPATPLDGDPPSQGAPILVRNSDHASVKMPFTRLACDTVHGGEGKEVGLVQHQPEWASPLRSQHGFPTIVTAAEMEGLTDATLSRPGSVVMSDGGSDSGNSIQMTPIEGEDSAQPVLTAEIMAATPYGLMSPPPQCPGPTVPPSTTSLEDYEVLQTLGTGTFGRVLLVRRKGADEEDRGSYFAMKVLRKSQIVRLKQVEHINSEREIMTKTDHPFVVKLHCTFQDSLNCYMLMEYVMGGEIFSHLRRAKRFSVDVTRFYIATLVLAIAHLHSKRVIYRDLKPENLLIDHRGYIKITDFGFSKELVSVDRTWTLCGTPEYLSPEVIQSQGQSFASDYWSLGILVFEMLCGHPPFFDSTPFGTYEKILKADIHFPKHVDVQSRSLIRALLTVDVSKRLGNLYGGAEDVKRHPWFQGVDWDMLLQRRLRAPIVPLQQRAGDSSNFEKYDDYSLSNMPGIGVGMEADGPDQQADPWRHFFTAF